MAQEDDVQSDMIDLGTASIDTKGPSLALVDEVGGIFPTGMSID